MTRTNNNAYRLSYNYGIKAFIAIALTACIIFLYVRAQLIENLENISNKSYTSLALTVNKTMSDILVSYYEQKDTLDNTGNVGKYPPELEHAAHELVADTSIVRAKIYDRQGTVLYSTKHSQIGDNQYDNPGFISAISGSPATKLIYRDTFNIFDHESENANLAQSYVPVWGEQGDTAIGVLEIYADINDLVVETVRTEIFVLIVILLVMGVLYGILMYAINRAEKIIEKQNRESREHQRSLEILSAKMISAQEDEKRRISFQLHEDVVQSMTAVKLHLEKLIDNSGATDNQIVSNDEIMPVLQDAIYKIRTVSMDLYPRSLDDFGIKAATKSLINDCQPFSNSTKIDVNINVQENELSDEKKSILYRIIKDTLQLFCYRDDCIDLVTINIDKDSENLTLRIEASENPEKSDDAEFGSMVADFDKMQEITILSGGQFHISYDSNANFTASSVWGY